MIKPSRNLVAYRSRNPIAIFSHELLYACRTYGPPFSKEILDCSDNTSLKFEDFISFVIFQIIAQKMKLEAPIYSLRQHIKNQAQREGISADASYILEKEKFYSRKLPIFLEAREAEMSRLKTPDIPAYKLSSGIMKGRENLKDGYILTRFQFLQIRDECDFHIKRVHELRRFINSRHSSRSDITGFYADLKRVSDVRSETLDIEDRIAYAINLDDYENKNLIAICYHIADYRSSYGIYEMTDDMKSSLIAVTGTLPFEKFRVRLKPVLLIKNLVPSALGKMDDGNARLQIERYKKLQSIGFWLRNNPVLQEPLFTTYKFTLEDFWEFIYYDYNIFNLYQGVQWAEKKKIFPILRNTIDSVTLDPYSTEF